MPKLDKATVASAGAVGIGELNEGGLHADLKARYAGSEGLTEVPVESFVADVLLDEVIYEVQTGSFSGLRRKMAALLERRDVVLIHPIARRSTMVKLPRDAKSKTTRRKVPGEGRLAHILGELIYLPDLLNHPGFSVEVVITEEEQIRVWDDRKRRGLGGWRVHERRLLDVYETWRITSPADLLSLLEGQLPDQFTTRQLADLMDEPLHFGQKMAYCLRHAGYTEICDKQGNSLVYRLTN